MKKVDSSNLASTLGHIKTYLLKNRNETDLIEAKIFYAKSLKDTYKKMRINKEPGAELRSHIFIARGGAGTIRIGEISDKKFNTEVVIFPGDRISIKSQGIFIKGMRDFKTCFIVLKKIVE